MAEENVDAKRTLPDGICELRTVLPLAEVMRVIERTARWVEPETFKLLPVWFPEHARGSLFYKANWSQDQMNANRQTGNAVHKREGNRYANMALTYALGLRSDARPNWSCCHIWGVDDPSYQQSNTVVQDHRFYTCVANMVLLPTPLKAFTDAMPKVKAMLRICARNLYGWPNDQEMIAKNVGATVASDDWVAYPASWPREPGSARSYGVMPLNAVIRADVAARLKRIRHDLEHAGKNYPKDKVIEALSYWRIEV